MAIERETRVRFEDDGNRFLMSVTGEKVTIKTRGREISQREGSRDFEVSAQRMWELVDEIQAALPKRRADAPQ